MSGLEINFSKSEVILINGDEDKKMAYMEMFNCQGGEFPIRNLGVPISPSRLHVKDWDLLLESRFTCSLKLS